jgi:hypothetical protein
MCGGGGSRDRTGLSQGNSRHRRKNREIHQIYAGKGTLGADSMPELKGLTAFSRGARDGN